MNFRPIRWARRFQSGSGILSDAVGYMDGRLTMEKYPDRIRRVKYRDEESKTGVHPLHEHAGYQPDDGGRTISSERQIELFFKWVKQHLRIKKFWGNSENAVRIQIYSAVISYCIRAIVQKKMRVKRSVYEMLQIVSVSLTDTTPLRDLFGKPNYNIVNELDDYSEPTLFDF